MVHRIGKRIGGLLALLSLLSPGCSAPPRPANVLMIVVDTLRSDHLGAFGYPRAPSPTCDALARNAVVFPDAISAAPWTLPSFASLFTSRSPSAHGMLWPDAVLRDDENTLAETLRDSGYRTAAFVNNPMLRPKRGLAQGFERFESYVFHRTPKWDQNPRPPVPQVEAWLDEDSDRPFFLLVHFMEPHAPYFPTGSLARLHDSDYEGPSAEMFPEGNPVDMWTPSGVPLTDVAADRRIHAVALYDAEILETDRQIGRILAALEDRGLDDDTIVVLLADHGEELWDHGDWGHGQSLHGELVRVPLVIRAPRVLRIAPRTDPSTVSLIDVAPTLLSMLGLQAPATFEGRALDLRGECGSTPVESGATHRGPARRSYQRDGWKLDLELFDGTPALYDLATDPGERVDRARIDPARAAELSSELLATGTGGGSGWRITMHGAEEGTAFEGTLRAPGHPLRIWPHRLDRSQDQKTRDGWTESEGEVRFRVKAGSGPAKGLMIQVEPWNASVEFTVNIDGRSRPDRVRIGPNGIHPAGDGPWLLRPDSARVYLGTAPADGDAAAPFVAVWHVPPAAGERGADRAELDAKTQEELRALGYVH